MKKLDILVPQYKEDETVISKLLDSIALQQGINFDDIGVIIVNDGTDVILSDDFLKKYKFDIKYIKAEHKGISETRNRALDESEAEYVMFCDDDDMFSCEVFDSPSTALASYRSFLIWLVLISGVLGR